MYTGITKGLFQVVSVDKKRDLITYAVDLGKALSARLELGDSVSIDGVCQTAVGIEGNHVTFQAIRETLSKTTLQDLYEGRWVSVERSARLGDENGGHELAGHIFEMGTVVQRKDSENNVTLVIQCSPQCSGFIFEKGFIGLDGSSLTVGSVDQEKGSFEVHLIPETLRRTNFSNKKVGDSVNVEVDAKAVIIASYLKQHFSCFQKRLDTLEAKIAHLENSVTTNVIK